uniref:Uncharacterized protein n=1 Tax=Arabidopsis thaliana TaxID=3702 RepID=Q56YJ2_ARATH|nr:hypothetical protein [Arabidopsis thaliana]
MNLEVPVVVLILVPVQKHRGLWRR